MLSPKVQFSATTTEAASVAATPALESSTPVVKAALAIAKAALLALPLVPSKIQFSNVTVTAALPIIAPGELILQFLIVTLEPAVIPDGIENPAKIISFASHIPKIVTSATFVVLGSV